MTTTVYRSASTGLFVTQEYAELHPEHTVKEEVDWDEDRLRVEKRRAAQMRVRKLVDEVMDILEDEELY